MNSQSFPPGWSQPSPLYNFCTYEYVYGDYTWWGKERATQADLVAIYPFTDQYTGVDKLSLCGTDDPKWTTQRDVLLANSDCY